MQQTGTIYLFVSKPLRYHKARQAQLTFPLSKGTPVTLANRLREIREYKNLNQGDVAKSSGLKSSYISRVENGHTTPSLETLEKLARALEVPLYSLFYSEKGSTPVVWQSPKRAKLWGDSGKSRHYLAKLLTALERMPTEELNFLMAMASKICTSRKPRLKMARAPRSLQPASQAATSR
jgi:transcriptional regulator with XRE-family HTH domain